MSETVLILGGSQCNKQLIETAQEAGYEVVVTDQNEDAVGLSLADTGVAVDITDVDGTLSVAREHDVDAVIPINDFGVRTAAAVASELGLPGLPPDVAETCTDKAAMRRRWDETEQPQPSFFVTDTLEAGRDALADLDVPVICKPAKSRGGSRGVSIVRDRDRFDEAYEFAATAFDDDPRVVVENCVTGSEHSIDLIVVDGEAHPIAISDKEKSPPPYRVDESVIYPTEHENRDEIARVAAEATLALRIEDGPAHVELAMTDEGPKLFEIGARIGGCATADPIIPALTGIEYFLEVVKQATGHEPDQLTPTYRRGVTYRFLTAESGTVESVTGLEAVRAMDGVCECQVWVSPGDEISGVQVGGDRCGSVVAAGETRADAYDLAQRAAEKVTINTGGP
jgi:biotin carboxylase